MWYLHVQTTYLTCLAITFSLFACSSKKLYWYPYYLSALWLTMVPVTLLELMVVLLKTV